jgi:hypothetical protein
MILDKLNKDIPFVKKDNFRLLFPSIKNNSYDQNIKNWLKSGKIMSLKRGIYIFQEFWNKCQNKDKYLNYLSSILYAPSYISRETVLARYGMLSEAVYGITCVSLKSTRIFLSKIASFQYSKIKSILFTGFKEDYFINNRYFIATKSKAFFDYLYFYKRKMRLINLNSIEELRINFDVMTLSDWKEFEKYLKLAESTKLNKIYKIIKKNFNV